MKMPFTLLVKEQIPQRYTSGNLYIASAALLSLTMAFGQAAYARSFFEVVERPLITHPEVKSSEANVQVQAQGINEIGGQFLPSVNLNGGVGRQKTDTPLIENKPNLTRRELSLGVTQLVYDGRGTSSRYYQQESQYRGAKLRLLDEQNKIMLKAVNAYLDAVKSREIASLAKANEQEHVTTLQKVKELYAGGAGRKGDISLAEGRLAQTRATLVKLENNIKDSNTNFKSIVGEDLTYKVRWPKVPEAQLPKSLDESLNIAMRNNPTLLTVREDAVGSNWAIGSARANFMPTVNFEVNASRNKNIDGTKGDNNDLQVMLRGNWNVFRGGSDVAKYQQSVEKQFAANSEISRTQRVVVQQVTQAWDQYQTAIARLEELRKHMVASREVLDAYEEQFKYGQRQLFNILDQTNELFDSKVAYVNGRDDMVRLSYELLSDVGKLTPYILSERSKEKTIEYKEREQEMIRQQKQKQQQILEKQVQRMQKDLDRSKAQQKQLESQTKK